MGTTAEPFTDAAYGVATDLMMKELKARLMLRELDLPGLPTLSHPFTAPLFLLCINENQILM